MTTRCSAKASGGCSRAGGVVIPKGGVQWRLDTERLVDLTLKTIVEFREEMREFRVETRKTLAEHSHRLNVIEATIASLKAEVSARRS